MDYHNKYIKYKTKYLQLKYNNQYGSGVVPCNKGLNNFIGTCWAVGIQMILFFGHLTSQEFNKLMELFNISMTRGKRITLRDSFIEEQINRVYKDLQLYDFLPAYIFHTPKRESLQIMLTTIINRYNSKVFESQITIKPPGITNPTENPLRCEKVIEENFKKLFDYKIIKRLLNTPGGSIETAYLFCNLLSIIFLNHKVSFTNYYNNFNLIDFKDETDLGILIITEDHVCCLFICNDKGQYYNDDDEQVYECDWKKLLNTPANDLYVINKGCLKFIDDSTIDMYDEAQISKVLCLTKISKYEKESEESELDNDIKKALTLTDTYTIRDPHLLLALGLMHQSGFSDTGEDLTHAFNFYSLCIKSGVILPNAYYLLGYMYYKGDGIEKDLKKAFDLFTISVNNRTIYPYAYYMLGTMYENGINTTVNLKEAFKLYTQTIKFAIKSELIYLYTILCVKLGNMHEKGLETPVNLEKAFELYTLAMNNGDKTVYVKLGNMYENGTGVPKNLEEAFKLYTLAIENGDTTLANSDDKDISLVQLAAKGDARTYLKLGEMYLEGTGVNKDFKKALEWYTKGFKKFPHMREFRDKITLVETIQLVKLAGENNIDAMYKLVDEYMDGMNIYLGKHFTKAKELLTKGIEILKDNSNLRLRQRFNEKLEQLQMQIDDRSEYYKTIAEFSKLAESNDVSALLYLGDLYNNNKLGFKDLEKAKEFYTKCAEILKDNPDEVDLYNYVLTRIDDVDTSIAETRGIPNIFT
jgi:TPR repeat protein